MKMLQIFWFRRDLRLEDNAGLFHALKSGKSVLPIFIFDETILEKLEDKKDKRVQFIHQEIERLNQELQALGSGLQTYYGKPKKVWETLVQTYKIEAVYCNRDYEPQALLRDEIIEKLLAEKGILWHSYKDQCIFEMNEICKDDGLPYTVFTPYSNRWKAKLWNLKKGEKPLGSNQNTLPFYLKPYPTQKYFSSFIKEFRFEPIPSLTEMGFEKSSVDFPSKEVNQSLIKLYSERRNFPAITGTSHLGIHFRFGTISIREKARKAIPLSETFLNELIWRDFYMQILWHFPHVAERSFKPAYDQIIWRNNESEFEAWCQGKTGYPIVDAGMRELNTTGFMHNRVRMIVASFLCKHLLIDWRWGEAYFAQKLLDFDLSANNGGWQWAAGCGTDAAPYFRVFNPALQTEKFDKEFTYIKKWVPEFGSPSYPKPIVEHSFARNRCLETYKLGINKLG
ncbi:MAG: DNA photolyase family protein [Bacteroidia bacterium]|nr:DNA photolyase family protein [Bacteroidia bacterium]MCF8427278.1 DNA photolyase family protein [Bacteroidia bacterium]MCF8447410.1 DNA photolyase family protein [Bacteroidia bacterium]